MSTTSRMMVTPTAFDDRLIAVAIGSDDRSAHHSVPGLRKRIGR